MSEVVRVEMTVYRSVKHDVHNFDVSTCSTGVGVKSYVPFDDAS